MAQTPTTSFRLPEAYANALRELGKRDGRRGATEALVAILDRDPEVSALLPARAEQADQGQDVRVVA